MAKTEEEEAFIYSGRACMTGMEDKARYLGKSSVHATKGELPALLYKLLLKSEQKCSVVCRNDVQFVQLLSKYFLYKLFCPHISMIYGAMNSKLVLREIDKLCIKKYQPASPTGLIIEGGHDGCKKHVSKFYHMQYK